MSAAPTAGPLAPLPSRRAALLGALAVGLAPVGTLAETCHPDAAVLALCARFEAIERAITAAYAEQRAVMVARPSAEWMATEEAFEPRLDALRALQEPLYQQMHDLRATTLAGVLAKARAVNLWDDGKIALEAADAEACAHDVMMWGVWRDLLALDPSQGRV